jgi:predicted peptidase
LFVALLLLAALLFVPSAFAGARAPSPDRAELVTHVFPETGHRVVAVALRYDAPVFVRRGSAARDAFTVVDGTPRSVVDVYSSAVLPGDEWRLDARPGRYLILELDPADANAAVNANSADGATAPRDLRGAYTITQTAALRDDFGRTLQPPPFALENDGIVQPVVDEFERRSFTDATGTRLAFRFFRPASPRRELPLVLVLHGGGETGSPQVSPANVTQITANRAALVWATREPAYVVAPQLPGRTSQWTEPAIQAAVMALVERLAAAYPIDRDRIYLTGLSRGGRGAVEFLSNHPTTFAGALLAAARAENDDVSEVAKFVRVPLWLTHAADDPVVPYFGSVDIAAALEAAGAKVTRGEWAGNNSAGLAQDRAAESAARRLLEQTRRTRSRTLFTTYTAGTVAVNAHFSWGPMYETDVMLDWLFAQERQRNAAAASPRYAAR